VMAATLREEGTVPEVREELMIAMMSWLRRGRQRLNSADGMGSSGKVVRWILLKWSVRSVSLITDREGRMM